MKQVLQLVVLGLVFPASGTATPINWEELMGGLAQETACSPLGPMTEHTLPDLAALSPEEAEILDEYGFHNLSEQRFRCRGETLRVQIYRMSDFAAAYGVFTLYRKPGSPVPEGFPKLAAESEAWIAFAQSNFYVRIRRPVRPPWRVTAFKAAQYLSQALPTGELLPSIVDYLPRPHRVAGSEVFVMGHRALNLRYPFGNADLFGLVHGAEAVSADYRLANGSAKLLLMIYPTQQLAKKYLERGYEQHILQHPDQRVFYKREGPLVVMVLDSTDPEIASSFLDQISYASSVSWDPKAEPLSVGRMMLNVFLYVGAVIGMTLLAGLMFGLLRVLISRLFPGKIFDRQESYEVIRLKLPPPR